MAGYRDASLAIPIPKSRSRSKKAKSLENTGSALYMDAMSPKSSLSTQSPFVPMSPKSPASSSCHDSSTSTAQQRWRHSRANSLSSNTRSLSSFRRSPSNSSLSSLPKQHELHERSKSLLVHSASEGASLMNLLDLKTNRSSRSPLSGRTLNSTPRTLAALAAAGAAGDVGMGRSFSSPASTSLADLNEFPSAASSCSVSLSVSSTKAAKPPAPIVVVTGDAEEDVEALPQTPYERKLTKDALFRGRLLLEKRCNVQECKPNGNCLFASVGFIVGETYDEVRQKCCDYIRRESTFFQDFCEEDVDDYVDKMECNGTWGGQMEIIALASIFQRPIEIHSPDSSTPSSIKPRSKAKHKRKNSLRASPKRSKPPSKSSKPPIMLSYHFKSHYNALVPVVEEKEHDEAL